MPIRLSMHHFHHTWGRSSYADRPRRPTRPTNAGLPQPMPAWDRTGHFAPDSHHCRWRKINDSGARRITNPMRRCRGTLIGIMLVTFGHLRPSGHIMPDHAGDRGAVPSVLAPHDHPAYQADQVDGWRVARPVVYGITGDRAGGLDRAGRRGCAHSHSRPLPAEPGAAEVPRAPVNSPAEPDERTGARR
jgi:hypothetical protein